MFEKATRREFMRTAAGGIAATWGGLQIFAGPQGFAQSRRSGPNEGSPEILCLWIGFLSPPKSSCVRTPGDVENDRSGIQVQHHPHLQLPGFITTLSRIASSSKSCRM